MRANIYLYLLVLPFWMGIAAVFVASCRILKRLGFRRWWCLFLFVPVANICAIWWLAFAAWPSATSVYRPTWQGILYGLLLTALALFTSSLIGEMQPFGKMEVFDKIQRFSFLLVLPSCCVLERVGFRKAWSLLHLIPLGSLIAFFLLAYLPWPSDLIRTRDKRRARIPS